MHVTRTRCQLAFPACHGHCCDLLEVHNLSFQDDLAKDPAVTIQLAVLNVHVSLEDEI